MSVHVELDEQLFIQACRASGQENAKRVVETALRLLIERAAEVRRPKRKPPLRLRDAPFVGMWKDRKEMCDSTAWVRRLRDKEWQRE